MTLFAARLDTPLGPFVVAQDSKGALVWAGFSEDPKALRLLRWATRHQETVAWRPRKLAKVRKQVTEYFARKRSSFDLPLRPIGTEFQLEYWGELVTVGYGETVTYAEMARRLGMPKAARAVGRANAANPLSLFLPCHRVVGSRGKLTGYAGGIVRKRVLLELERGRSEELAAERARRKSSPPPALDTTLDDIADRLAKEGLADQAEALRAAQTYVDAIERPPGIFTRVTGHVRQVATKQWGHVVAEMQESRDAWSLIQKRMSSGEKLTPEEADAVKAQLFDVFRVVPASVVTAATFAVPVPGAALLSPWVLRRLGLLPSRWREAHVLEQLRKQHAHLEEIGQQDSADEIGEILAKLEAEAAARERVAEDCAVLEHWDHDKDGRWSDEERKAYDKELRHLARRVKRAGVQRRWFVLVEQQVYGPSRWSELPEGLPDMVVMVSENGETGWVDLRHLRAVVRGEKPNIGGASEP